MTLRNYSSTAAETTLSGGVDASTTTLAVSATTGFPATPFVLSIDAGAAAQELVLVTNVAGTTLTVTRAYDSTVGAAHDTGAVVAHSHAALDFREANSHINAWSGVHGLVGSVVGATDAQILTNKTVALGSNTLSGTKAQFNTAMTDADFATQAGAETLTNKTLSSATNVFPWVIQSGSGTDTVAAVQINTQPVVFPTPFASVPHVVASVADERFVASVKNITTTGFDLVTNYMPGAPLAGFGLGYSWVAIL